MDAPEIQEKAASRSNGPRRPWVSLVILFVFSATNIFLPLFIVPKVAQIYADALPGKPLPFVTEVIISVPILWALMALIWSLPAVLSFWRRKDYAILLINVGMLLTCLQIGITVLALFMPMTGGLIVGMSDSNHS